MAIKVLDRLFLKGFWGPYVLSFFIVEFVLVMQTLWKVIDDILGKGYGILDYFELLFYLSVVLIPMALPLTVLLSSVMVYGEMSEKYELTAVKSAGVSLFRMLRPGLIVAFLTMSLSIFASNFLKPDSNERFMKKMKDMKTNELTFVFDEKIFNRSFKGYSIWIDHKLPDGKTIEGVMIYDHNDVDKSVLHLTKAKKGEMYTTHDQKYLVMELYDGYMIKEVRGESADRTDKGFNLKGRPVSRVYFSHLRKSFELAELLNLSINSMDHQAYEMMNSAELLTVIDSLTIQRQNKIEQGMYNFGELTKDYTPTTSDPSSQEALDESAASQLDKLKQHEASRERSLTDKDLKKPKQLPTIVKPPPFILDPVEVNQMLDYCPEDERLSVLDRSIKNARAVSDRAYNKNSEIRMINNNQSKHVLRLHQQYSWALVCLIFLFIGGPAGAIVRKGGFGLPLLIAIVFYMIFIMTNIAGEKLMASRALSDIQAAWLPCFLLVPFAIYLTWLSLNDKNITKQNPIVSFFLNWREKRKKKQRNIISS